MAQYLTGIDLHAFLENPLLGQEAIVEGLIFKDTINIFYSDPSCGKSVFAVNMLASMSTGSPVFGHFPMTRAYRSSYLQLEGSREEQLGRLKEMMADIKVNLANIAWHDDPIFVENPHSQQEMFDQLLEFKPEVIFIDSFYCLTSKGLSKDEFFLPVRHLVQQIKKLTGATIIILHHSLKVQYDGAKKVEKDDPFLGSQYLKAFVDMMMYMKREGDNQIVLKTTKASRNNEGIKKLTLQFNKSNWCLKVVEEGTCASAITEIIAYLNHAFKKETEITVDMIVKNTNLTKRHIRRLKNDGHFDKICSFVEANGLPTIWKKL